VIVREVFQKLIPPLSEEEFKLLEQSILEEGCRDPLILWGEILVDGHNRYQICKNHDIPYETTQIEFDDESDATLWIIRNQLGRRNINKFVRGELALKMKPLLTEKGKRHMAEGLQNSANLDTREELAKQADISHDTIHKVEKILEEAPPEIIEEVRSGEKSIHRAYQEVKKPHVSHNSGNNEWYTPKPYIDAAHRVMGRIDLDPASSAMANETVGALKYHTIEDDGLTHAWLGKIWMNPPYSSDKIEAFCTKLVSHVNDCLVEEAIVLVNNATETQWFQSLIDVSSAAVFPSKRIRFVTPDGAHGSPLQGQAIIYIGNNVAAFLKEFLSFGWGASICKM